MCISSAMGGFAAVAPVNNCCHLRVLTCMCAPGCVCVFLCVTGDGRLRWWVYRRGNSLQPSDSAAVDISVLSPFVTLSHLLLLFPRLPFSLLLSSLLTSPVLLSFPFFIVFPLPLPPPPPFSTVPHTLLICSPLYSPLLSLSAERANTASNNNEQSERLPYFDAKHSRL